ncbi:dephospho-CoA kinase domain-containing protein [Lampetra fluviatilis]
MFLVGLTGGIASGKSTVASIFRELGCPVIDADEIARLVVEPGRPALKKIVEFFGEEVLHSDGRLNREKLGAIIFAEPQKRRLLNSITHPDIRRHMLKQILWHFVRGYHYVILDVPLLFENKTMSRFIKHSIVVYCDPESQLSRLMQRNSLSRHEAELRVRAQIPLDQKRLLADHVIDNCGEREATRRQVVRLHTLLDASLHHLPVRLLAVLALSAAGGVAVWLLGKLCVGAGSGPLGLG